MNASSLKTDRFSRSTLSIAILVIVYSVGIAGVKLAIHEDFLLLTPLNLLLSLALVLWNHTVWNRFTYLFILVCFLVGFFAEVIGVNTGLIFGNYVYGPVLGWKLWHTPLIIGVNWVMLAYCSGVVANYLLAKAHWIIKAIFAASLMVGLDVLIEPVAIRYDFWTWQAEVPPLQNYIGWFFVALPLLLLFHSRMSQVKNKVALVLFILQIIFFSLL